MIMVALTGPRGVGKSNVARLFNEKHGWMIGHAFNPGKAMCVAYFMYSGADKETAERMTYGDLRDVPSSLLPDNQTPRYFMEHFGKWIGTHPTMGPAWSLGAEIRHLSQGYKPNDGKMIFDSMVYEADYFREQGGIIVRVKGPKRNDADAPASDEFQNKISADFILDNSGTWEELEKAVLMMQRSVRNLYNMRRINEEALAARAARKAKEKENGSTT